MNLSFFYTFFFCKFEMNVLNKYLTFVTSIQFVIIFRAMLSSLNKSRVWTLGRICMLTSLTWNNPECCSNVRWKLTCDWKLMISMKFWCIFHNEVGTPVLHETFKFLQRDYHHCIMEVVYNNQIISSRRMNGNSFEQCWSETIQFWSNLLSLSA
jgi:hypothetical protein